MRRDGFSLLEMLVALAVLALGAGFVTVRAGVALDQMAAHAAHLELQSQLSALRRRVVGDQVPVLLKGVRTEADEDETRDPPTSGPDDVVLAGPDGWTLHLEKPLSIAATGACGAAALELRRANRKPVRLVTRDGACGLLRLS